MVRSLSLECKLELVPLSATPASKVPGCRWCPGAIVLVLGSYCTHLLPRILSCSPWQFGTLC